MWKFVLIVRLMEGMQVETIPVHDCSAIKPWIHAAWDWADRSEIPLDVTRGGPMVICVPMSLMNSTTPVLRVAQK